MRGGRGAAPQASQIFSELSAAPVAAASLGQVYRGRLASTGDEVARPPAPPRPARPAPPRPVPHLTILLARDGRAGCLFCTIDQHGEVPLKACWVKYHRILSICHETIDTGCTAVSGTSFGGVGSYLLLHFREYSLLHFPFCALISFLF